MIKEIDKAARDVAIQIHVVVNEKSFIEVLQDDTEASTLGPGAETGRF